MLPSNLICPERCASKAGAALINHCGGRVWECHADCAPQYKLHDERAHESFYSCLKSTILRVCYHFIHDTLHPWDPRYWCCLKIKVSGLDDSTYWMVMILIKWSMDLLVLQKFVCCRKVEELKVNFTGSQLPASTSSSLRLLILISPMCLWFIESFDRL